MGIDRFILAAGNRSIEKFHMSGLHFRVPNTCCRECDLCKPHISTRVTFSDVNIKARYRWHTTVPNGKVIGRTPLDVSSQSIYYPPVLVVIFVGFFEECTSIVYFCTL
ncbi:uncharacterized protein LAJ45_01513 [Morchella importuna]|uniref:uncharacterized protein n=1 Tax=Morchella importuna TaxID=1174673 RepID=UPI001E8D3025|nr:uncharacterized protein LAJ45_01513 [Morchella importuna]KAH8154980.1 hypothetical protein LAJ45_01513 [Morchella importuna]